MRIDDRERRYSRMHQTLRAALESRRGAIDPRRARCAIDRAPPRRHRADGEQGTTFLLDLDRSRSALRDGDGLVLDDGWRSCVVAGRPSRWSRSRAEAPLDLVRLAWHIGNRHTDVQVVGDRLRIRRDHVLEDMVRGLGATLDAGRGAVRSGARRLCTAAHGQAHDEAH